MDPTRRAPARLLLPPPPRDPEARAAWDARDLDDRLRLARCATAGTDPGVDQDRALVRAVAAARVATGWRLRVGAVVFGWLVLMTFWGFGRAQRGDEAVVELVVGLIGGLAAGATAWRAGSRRLQVAREVAAGRFA
jgi:hypothetical protein